MYLFIYKHVESILKRIKYTKIKVYKINIAKHNEINIKIVTFNNKNNNISNSGYKR